METKVVYSTDSYEHECNLLGIDASDNSHLELENLIPEEKLCQCGQFEIYSKSLTDGLCLNCYHVLQEDIREMEIECRHDYEEGLL